MYFTHSKYTRVNEKGESILCKKHLSFIEQEVQIIRSYDVDKINYLGVK